MTAQGILNTRSLRAEFSTLAMATTYCERCINYAKWTIIQGDNDKFWVMTNRDASILVKAGFEYAD